MYFFVIFFHVHEFINIKSYNVYFCRFCNVLIEKSEIKFGIEAYLDNQIKKIIQPIKFFIN